MLFLKWFTSRTVRHAWQAANHVHKIVQHQRDLLSADALSAVQGDIENVRVACRAGNKQSVGESLAKLEKSANKWLKPYPHSVWRENIEVALVAIAVAIGIRTFFLQPFKIPTGSMQPTLYGVTEENLTGRTDIKIPGPIKGFFEYWFNGVSYKHVVAKTDGILTASSPPTKLVLFNLRQTFRVGNTTYTVWFPPDDLLYRAGLAERGGRIIPREFRTGDDIIKLRIVAGDHLFVDRVSYNFCRPRRGDIVVFETHGIAGIATQASSPEMADTYYIKRLCGLGGETISLKKDYDVILPNGFPVPVGHLVVNGTNEITHRTPRFENLYSFPDATSTRKSFPRSENQFHYVGHALMEDLSPGKEFHIRPHHYFVMGDNTLSSFDSRYWGDFEEQKVIGQSFFVYWPIGGTTYNGEDRPSRFGWSHR
jgi:signal peptidase I